jgi:hypothetical protein
MLTPISFSYEFNPAASLKSLTKASADARGLVSQQYSKFQISDLAVF